MGHLEGSDIPYDERTDDHKLQSNWRKAMKQFERSDFSASIVRIATSAEISANIYIRTFLLVDHNLPHSYVNALLKSANGLDGKFKRLIKPAAEVRGTWPTIKLIQKRIEDLHEHRNDVVHAGRFKNGPEARDAFAAGLEIIRTLAPNEAALLSEPPES